MKTRLNIWAIVLLSYFGSFHANAQQHGHGVKIVSGSKSIYTHPGVFERIADEVYLRHYEAFSKYSLDEFKKQVRSATEQTTWAESLTLSTSPYFEMSEEQGRILLKYKLNLNEVNFRLTTPDIAFGIGTGRGADPKYSLSWNMAFVYEISTNGNLEQLEIFYKGVELSDQKLNDRSILDNLWIEMFTNSYPPKVNFEDWTLFGFRNYLYQISAISALPVKDGIQQYFNEKIKLNQDLLEETRIDGTTTLNLKCDLSNNTLVFEHPHSPSGIVYRTSTEKVRDANLNLSVPSTTVPVSKNASTLNKKPLSASSNSSNTMVKKKINIP